MGMGMGDTEEGAFGAAGPMSHRSRAGEQTLNCLQSQFPVPTNGNVVGDGCLWCWGWVHDLWMSCPRSTTLPFPPPPLVPFLISRKWQAFEHFK